MYWNHIRHKGFVWNDRFLTSIQSLVFLEFSSLASLSEYCWYCLQSIPSCTAWNYRYFHHWRSWYCLQFIPSCTAQYYRYFHHWHNWASTVGTVYSSFHHVQPKITDIFIINTIGRVRLVLFAFHPVMCTVHCLNITVISSRYFILEQPESSLLYFLWNSNKVLYFGTEGW